MKGIGLLAISEQSAWSVVAIGYNSRLMNQSATESTLMKAFISHSSNDKSFVRPITDELSELRCEFDEYTFDFELNTAALRTALKRCDLFVMILSANSIKSTFVNEEIRATLEARGAGRIKKVLIFSIDQTTYRELPAWMREINVAQHLRSPLQIAKRIDVYLEELAIASGDIQEFYVGRDAQAAEIRRVIAKPKSSCPLALHLVGTYGLGRRTLLRRSLKEYAPRQYHFFVEMSIEQYDGIFEFYRKLYDLMEINNPLLAGEELQRFNKLASDKQIAKIADYIRELSVAGGMLILNDEGGIYQDNGDYQEFFPPLISAIADIGRPMLGVIQSRMMRENLKLKYPRSYHLRVPALEDEFVYELMCLKLRDLGVEFEEEDVRKACAFTDGYPSNIDLVVSYIAHEGMDVTLADPSELIEVKVQKGDEFLRRVKIGEIEGDLLVLLHEYRFCDLEFVIIALGLASVMVSEAVRYLDDICCIERRDRMITLSPLIRDAIRRDKRLNRDERWYADVASRIVSSFSEYSGDESLPISLIDSAIPELLRSGKGIPFISALVLPSHYLRVARDYYDKGNWTRSVEFCRKCIDFQALLTTDAKIEAHRLLGLGVTRLKPANNEVSNIIRTLNGYGTRTARRVAFFIEGFRHRKQGNYEYAKISFENAKELASENVPINRELSSVLCKLGKYGEAEPYARSALQRSAENPYVIDVLIEVLEGKQNQGSAIDKAELARLTQSLKVASEASGKQFYRVRQARRMYEHKQKVEALTEIRHAIDMERDGIQGYLHRAKFCIKNSDVRAARIDVENLRNLHNAEATRYADEVEIECLIVEGRFMDAKSMIDEVCGERAELRNTMGKKLSSAIIYNPTSLPSWLLDWARSFR